MKEFPSIPSDNLVYFGFREEPYFISYHVCRGLSDRKRLKKIFGCKQPPTILQANYEFFHVKSDLEQFQKEFKNKFEQSGGKYIAKLVSGCFKAGEQFIKISKRIGNSAKKDLSKAELAKLLNRYNTAAYNYCIYYNISFVDKPARELAEKIARKYSDSDAEFNRSFSLITSPSRLTAAEHEQDDFLKLVISDAQGRQKEQLALHHAQKYGWLGIRYFVGSPWTKAEVLQRLKNADKKSAKTSQRTRLKHRLDLEKSIRLLYKKINKEDRELVKQIRLTVFLRTQRSDYHHHTCVYIQPLLEKISKLLRIKYEDSLYFNVHEIGEALNGDLKILTELKNRKTNLLMFQDTKGAILSGADASKYIRLRPILQRKFTKLLKISGKPAFHGVVRGPAKTVVYSRDIPKVNRGDVLFSIMTTPNFIPAMEKAAAFVTDEGGILCHAAIVSREMRKPCIIGTKIGTKVFKDGDLVEVDANKGIVRLVSTDESRRVRKVDRL